MNQYYKYGPSLVPIQSITVKKNNDVESFNSSISNIALENAIINSFNSGVLNNIDLNLDSINSTSSFSQNLSVDSIDKFSDNKFRILSDVRIEGNTLFGTSNDEINSNYKVQILGDFIVEGTNIIFNSDQLKIKDNCIGLGVSNTNLDNFINGYYFPKNDNYSSSENSSNKIGLIALPYGTFSSNIQYNYKNSNLNRFSDNKNNFRFVYISDKFDFDTSKTTSNPFSSDEMAYVNSLNNNNDEVSQYFTNIEVNNLIIHGGYIITGPKYDLNLTLTPNNNQEVTYISCKLNESRIDFYKSLNLDLNTYNISFKSVLNFTNQADSPSTYFSLSNTENVTNRQLRFKNNGSSDPNIVFDHDIFSINKGDLTSPKIIIDTTTNNNKIDLNSRLTVDSVNSSDYEVLKLSNSNTSNKVSTSPTSKIYLQSATVNSNSSKNFTCLEVGSDFILTGIIKLKSTTEDKHLVTRLDSYYDNTFENTFTYISKKNVAINNLNSTSDFVITPSISGNDLILTITNNLTSNLTSLIRLEVIYT